MWETTMLARLVTAICRRPAVTVVAVLLLAVLGGWYSAVALKINTSAAEMISPDVPFRQHDKAYDAAFPDTEDRIVVVIDAPSPDQGDAAASRLACSPSTMPSVMQVSSPSALTWRTISSTTRRSFPCGLFHAAPMQKRLAPASLAARA